MSKQKNWFLEWAGREFTVEVGKYAGQTNASCTCRYGGTEVLATVVQGVQARDGVDYFPLMVDYEEKFYAAGKIKGSRFIKREGRPTDEAVLIGRMIDRAIRPLFDTTSRLDVQIVLTVFSLDDKNDADIPAFIAASVALAISDIPWNGPISAVRVGLINDELVLNPSYEARKKADMDFVVATTEDNKLIMAEAEASNVKDEKVLEAIEFAKKQNKEMIIFIKGIQKEIGKEKKNIEQEEFVLEQEHLDAVNTFLNEKIPEFVFNKPKANKKERQETIIRLKKALDEHLKDMQVGKEKREKAVKLVKSAVEEAVTRSILEDGKRVDGRGLTEIRPIEVGVNLFARTHGSALFVRGETQVVSLVTLGSPGDAQLLDTMESEETKHYMHHYNFPSFSVGEVGPMRGPGRRDIGHGALAEKALRAVLPENGDFPYTIRVVSEVLSSNGSSSMAASCGSSLALMDAGVPLETHVAGIAIGLASNEKENKYVVITDLQDLEDGPGGMDFKICGTKNGITAIQMDTKTSGLPDKVVKEAFLRARAALNEILDKMSAVIAEPNKELSQYAPRIHTLNIDPEKIGLVIGPGGKMINKIIEVCEVDIDIEKDGTVLVTAVSAEGAKKAIKMINDLTREIEVGEVFEGKVTKVLDFGAFVALTPSQEGMVHVSNLSNEYVSNINDAVKVGDKLKVKVIKKDDQGRINLTVDGVEPKPPRDNDRGKRGGGFRGGRKPFQKRPRY